MQILHWLLRASHEKGIDHSTSSTNPSNQKGKKVNGTKEADQPTKHIIVFKGDTNSNKSNTKRSKASYKKYLKLVLLCRKDIATACFYSTINLKSPRSDVNINTRRSSEQYYSIGSMKMIKKEDIISKGLGISNKVDHTGNNKVLPISETTTTTTTTTSANNDQNSGVGSMEKKEKSKGDKAKTMSKMKELLRWAAAAKSEKGGKFISRKVLQFRNRGNPKALIDDDQFSYESPKISFRWEVESCSTTSSIYSAISVTSLKNNPNLSTLSLNSSNNNNNNIQGLDHSPTRKGNWITSDSEFVVLEL